MQRPNVCLADFVTWALSLSSPWDMPPELVALAQKPAVLAGEPAPAPTPGTDHCDDKSPTVIWTEEKREQLRQEHVALKMKDHKSPTKELAEKYGISEQRIRELKADKKAEQVENQPSKNKWPFST